MNINKFSGVRNHFHQMTLKVSFKSVLCVEVMPNPALFLLSQVIQKYRTIFKIAFCIKSQFLFANFSHIEAAIVNVIK